VTVIDERQAVKTCIKCGQAKPVGQFHRDKSKKGGYRNECRDCACARVRDYNAAHQAEQRKRNRAWAVAHPDRQRVHNRRWYERAREAVLDHYGRECACCGATELLTIDHMNGDGANHRRQLRSNDPSKVWSWLRRNGFPAGFQTLCNPCNVSKGTGPSCRLDHNKEVIAA